MFISTIVLRIVFFGCRVFQLQIQIALEFEQIALEFEQIAF